MSYSTQLIIQLVYCLGIRILTLILLIILGIVIWIGRKNLEISKTWLCIDYSIIIFFIGFILFSYDKPIVLIKDIKEPTFITYVGEVDLPPKESDGRISNIYLKETNKKVWGSSVAIPDGKSYCKIIYAKNSKYIVDYTVHYEIPS